MGRQIVHIFTDSRWHSSLIFQGSWLS